MFEIPPKVAAIHDLSCFGRCALTVIIPTLSVLGAQVVPVPTALLSTHTGGFADMYFADLSNEMDAIADHFHRLGLKFDAIYSGFLGSEAQIERVEGFIDLFAHSGTPVLVDPVMGDGGELYSTYTKELGEGMKRLVRKADMITPNYTEACFLTDTPYTALDKMSENEVEKVALALMEKLSSFGVRNIAITGMETFEKVYTFGVDSDNSFVDSRPRLSAGYPGTGDIFASVVLGEKLKGKCFREAVSSACGFTAEVIKYTMGFPTPHRDGVMLEACLGKLIS